MTSDFFCHSPHFFPSFFTHAGGCTACSVNTYKSATGLGTCTNCGSGSNTNGVTGATSALQCVCSPGKTLNSATCPSGYDCSSKMNAKIACKENSGTWSGPSFDISNWCTGCTGGPCATDGTCVNCLVNLYKVASSNAACDTCPSGTMTGGVTGASTLLGCKCPSGKKGTDPNSCALCDVGQYKSSVGFASTCDTCPSGSTTASTGSTALSACVCPAGSRGTASASCVLCDAGQYKSAFGFAEVCDSCPASASAAATSRGTTETTGSITFMDCECPAGSLDLEETPSPQCALCDVGKYKSFFGFDDRCTTCPSGSTTATTGSIASSACVCPAGSRGTNSGSCALCDVGQYKSAVGFASSCDTCPSGSTTATTGSIASAACECPAGSRGTNSASCALCDAGQYKSAFGFASSCDTCPSGSTTATTGSIASAACVCPAGSRGTISASCALCDVGQYKSSIGFSSTYVVFYLFH